MNDPKTYLFHLPLRAAHVARQPLTEMWWPGARAAARHVTSRRDDDTENAIEALVIHATA